VVHPAIAEEHGAAIWEKMAPRQAHPVSENGDSGLKSGGVRKAETSMRVKFLLLHLLFVFLLIPLGGFGVGFVLGFALECTVGIVVGYVHLDQIARRNCPVCLLSWISFVRRRC
jgi:uncharacterized membrane protein YhhN